MPKRKRETSVERMKRKIKHYEEKLRKRQRPPSPTPSSPSSTPSLSAPKESDPTPCATPQFEEPVLIQDDEPITRNEEEESLDEEILSLLGEPPRDNQYGPNIHKDLASRWTEIFKNGLTKEKRSELKKKFLVPSNCKLIGAPKLNLEAQATLRDLALKREKAIANKQDQIGSAITALAMIFAQLVNNKAEDKHTLAINYVCDTARLLCDHQYQESMTRRNFALQGFEPTARDAVKDTEIDQWIFGETFADKLKASKAIKKSGQEISANKSTRKPHQQYQPRKSLNLKGPVNYQSRSYAYQAGPQRTNYQTYKKPMPHHQSALQTRKSYFQNKAPPRLTNNHK